MWSKPIDVTPAATRHHHVRGVEPAAESRLDRARRRRRARRSARSAMRRRRLEERGAEPLHQRRRARSMNAHDLARPRSARRRRRCARGSRRGAATCSARRAGPARAAAPRRWPRRCPCRSCPAMWRTGIREVRIAQLGEQRARALESELECRRSCARTGSRAPPGSSVRATSTPWRPACRSCGGAAGRRCASGPCRCTTWSTMPWSRRNSAVWNPSGRSCPSVCLMTRGPAKPITAPGSARIASPSIA